MRWPIAILVLATAVPSLAVAAPTIYEVNFDERPSYLPTNTIVLTFDDGPDETNTARTLDVLAQKNVKATFFINTDNAANVNVDLAMQALVRRIVDEGHELANHSVHHLALALLKPEELEEEIAGVEQTVCNVVGSKAPRLTLFRAPFGDPYLGPLHGVGYDVIAPIVAKHAVHIGWAIDSNDWRTPDSADTIVNNITSLIKTPGQGSYGVILMHSIHPGTVAALPRIIDYVRSKGFVFKLTEDVVRARFGKVSGDLIPGMKTCVGNGSGADAGADGSVVDATGTADVAGAAADTGSSVADTATAADMSRDVGAAIADASGGGGSPADARGAGGTGSVGGRGGTTSEPEEGTGGRSGPDAHASAGCSCRTAGGSPGGPWLLLGVALALWVRRRR